MVRPERIFYSAAMLCAGTAARATTLKVGPGQAYPSVSAAVAAAQAGDTVLVQAGTYRNDFPVVTVPLTFATMGGRVVMQASGDIPNDEGILVVQANTSIDGFTFTGARISAAAGANGAGIRVLTGNLVLKDCWFEYNQDGVFANPGSYSVTVLNSQFNNNGDASGAASGHTHNLYVDAIARLDVESSFFARAIDGHDIKSRALVTVIRNTRIVDGPTATASYSVDLPNGGRATLANLQIEQGPNGSNPIIIAYGEEGGLPSGSHLTVRQSLLENDLTRAVPLGVWNPTSTTVTLSGLRVYGLTPGELVSGPATVTGTTWLTTEPRISTRHPFR